MGATSAAYVPSGLPSPAPWFSGVLLICCVVHNHPQLRSSGGSGGPPKCPSTETYRYNHRVCFSLPILNLLATNVGFSSVSDSCGDNKIKTWQPYLCGMFKTAHGTGRIHHMICYVRLGKQCLFSRKEPSSRSRRMTHRLGAIGSIQTPTDDCVGVSGGTGGGGGEFNAAF